MKAYAAHLILKRIDDDNVGKGLFSQVLADKISKNEVLIETPDYIKRSIYWVCSIHCAEEKIND